MLFTARLKNCVRCNIYCLFEHKSQPEKHTSLQLYKYMGVIWENEFNKDELPIIIPIVIYHGSRKWKISQSFINLFSAPPKNLTSYIPDFSYLLYDLNKEQPKGDEKLKLFITVLQLSYKRDIINYAESFLKLAKHINDIFFMTTLLYLLKVNDRLNVDILIEIDKKLKTNKVEMIMSVADRLIKKRHTARRITRFNKNSTQSVNERYEHRRSDGADGTIERRST